MARRSSGRLVATLVVAAALASCTRTDHREETQAVTSRTIEAVLAAHTDSLMALPGVVGTAIGLCDGAPCIRVFLADSGAAARRRRSTRPGIRRPGALQVRAQSDVRRRLGGARRVRAVPALARHRPLRARIPLLRAPLRRLLRGARARAPLRAELSRLQAIGQPLASEGVTRPGA